MGRGAVEMARHLRRVMTPQERVLWGWLRDRRAHGFKFRRQVPFEGYVLDFYCAELRLVVEVDGGIHLEPGSARVMNCGIARWRSWDCACGFPMRRSKAIRGGFPMRMSKAIRGGSSNGLFFLDDAGRIALRRAPSALLADRLPDGGSISRSAKEHGAGTGRAARPYGLLFGWWAVVVIALLAAKRAA